MGISVVSEVRGQVSEIIPIQKSLTTDGHRLTQIIHATKREGRRERSVIGGR